MVVKKTKSFFRNNTYNRLDDSVQSRDMLMLDAESSLSKHTQRPVSETLNGTYYLVSARVLEII